MLRISRLRRLAGLVAGLMLTQAQAAEFNIFDVELDSKDALRFAELFTANNDTLTSEQIQTGYLDGAGRGVAIFTPDRISDAEHMATVVASRSADYRYAIDHCLAALPLLNQELRAIYLAYHGLLPDLPLPDIYVVFGAANSGGTATAQGQVAGLEVMCRSGIAPAAFRRSMRAIFAHETVHSWQGQEDEALLKDALLYVALREGVPDYLASLVTGEAPSAERESWARPQEKSLWKLFQKDRKTLFERHEPDPLAEPRARAALLNWFANYGNAPKGWPYEAGYWTGMQIAAAYVEHAEDKNAAIKDLIELRNPQAILAASGYETRMAGDQ
jgi:hypothetical protein